MREARAGDRYLLCSDGLSDPVSHDTILEALQILDVAESADRLIELALRGGGPDNVTVVVADVIDYDYGQTQPILAGAVSGDDDHVAPPNTAAGRASAFNPRRNTAKRVVPQPEEPVRRPRSRRRMVIAAVLLALLVLAGLAIGREIVRSNYYVSEHDGTVAIMRGVPGSILGYPLQEPYRLGCLTSRDELNLISPGQSPAIAVPSKSATSSSPNNGRCYRVCQRVPKTRPSARSTNWHGIRCCRYVRRAPPPPRARRLRVRRRRKRLGKG